MKLRRHFHAKILLVAILALGTAWLGAQNSTSYNPWNHTLEYGTAAPTPGCRTYTVTSTNAAFIVASTTATVSIQAMPAGAIVAPGIDVKHSAQFSDGAGAMTQVSVSIGSAGGGATFYTSATNIGEATAVANTTLQSTALFKRYTSAAENLNAVFTATGRNFGDGAATFLTGGSVDIKACWVVP